MRAPKYEWVCQKCQHANNAHTAQCAGCGFSAYFKVAQLPEPVELPAPMTAAKQNQFGDNFIMFFPEVIPALMIVLCAPVWAMRMFGNGNALPALGLLGGVVAFSAGFIYAYRRGRKWQAYAFMFAILVLAAMVSSAAT